MVYYGQRKYLKPKPNRNVSEDFKSKVKTIFHHLTKEELVDKIIANYLAQTGTFEPEIREN